MKTYFGLNKVKKFRKAVVALGVFDGVHIGHRHILRQCASQARRINGTSVVVTFYPHPQGQLSLYSLKHRLRLIEELGVDVCIVINFTRHFAQISALDFMQKILMDKIGARFIFVGKNFRFGKRAAGEIKLLEKFSTFYGYKVISSGVIKKDDKPVSSTYVRALITSGKLIQAQKLLQRPVTVYGTVIRGISLARKIGFPTANINPHHEIMPPPGVYAVEIIFDKKNYQGVCNIGKRMVTIHQQRDKYVEVHIFNFSRNIYGKDLEILFVKKIRQEMDFSGAADFLGYAAGQIKKDIQAAKNIFSRH